MRFFKSKISISNIYIAIVAYMYFPLFLFVLGWTAIFVSIPVVTVTSIAIVFSMRKIYNENRNEIYMCFGELFLVFFLFFILVGHSDLAAQDFDWHKQHAGFI